MEIGVRKYTHWKNKKTESKILKITFDFSSPTSRDDNSAGGGKTSETRDNNLSADYEQADPGLDSTKRNQHDQSGCDQHFISQGIHELAEGSFNFIFSCKVPIHKISEGGQGKDTKSCQPNSPGLSH